MLGAIGLTPRAKKVIELAVDEARRMNHRYIGTEHLLLALMREGEGIAGGVLKSQGLSLEDLRTTTIQLVGSSSTLHAREETIRQQIFSSGVTFTIFPQDIPYGQLSPLSISALTFAGGELARLKQLLLTPELLLLGLLHEGSSPAAQALQKQGVTIDKARSIIEQKEPEQEPDSTHPGISVLLSAYLLIAHKEAQTRDEELISPEHLLLAMLRDEQGPLENILTALGTTRTKVRETLIPLL
ncbi:ClpA/ClpB-like protein [Thermosporothrix hazakensis]|uniref:ClpA/ClpB-like protein n=2 Tax=Thermosporothrix TaxID=768650 RepID=A0A326UWL6_THEHA|nr:Clp protease N-terminal domain-containing protein [Thermosporothrix hazakensis]PZW36733.1 ClpA/ClpB-like protein [Thermosporothrix hazakensis]BBH89201.1 hypothetical protein KTC_39520 [Thermosporothrix sp. COM3]GCE47383.1 hypothetical protein KTH_22520 [Thermosporothrix hazakensis]